MHVRMCAGGHARATCMDTRTQCHVRGFRVRCATIKPPWRRILRIMAFCGDMLLCICATPFASFSFRCSALRQNFSPPLASPHVCPNGRSCLARPRAPLDLAVIHLCSAQARFPYASAGKQHRSASSHGIRKPLRLAARAFRNFPFLASLVLPRDPGQFGTMLRASSDVPWLLAHARGMNTSTLPVRSC